MMSEKDYAPLSPACVRALHDKLYEKRTTAAHAQHVRHPRRLRIADAMVMHADHLVDLGRVDIDVKLVERIEPERATHIRWKPLDELPFSP